jgi:lipid-binding SYLF domain-containing protein
MTHLEIRFVTRCSVILLSGMLLTATAVQAASKQDERLADSAEVLKQIMDTPDKSIPNDLLARSMCVGIFPSVKKAAFVVGGSYGAGFILCRKNQGKGAWGPPSAFSMSSGSFGFQIGASATDYVMLFMNQDGVEKLLQDKVTLGADAAVAAGPVGRSAKADTDAQMTAKVLGYARSKGLFAGLALNGAVLKASGDDNEALYGKKIPAKELLMDATQAPPASASKLIQELNDYSSSQSKKAL